MVGWGYHEDISFRINRVDGGHILCINVSMDQPVIFYKKKILAADYFKFVYILM